MRQIEEFISPFIQSQFPEFYREEGSLFIAFVQAYYEWMEQNFQELIFENPVNFNVGDTITQGTTTGTIVSKNGNNYLVKINGFDLFRCNTLCNDLTIATSSSGGVSYITLQRRFSELFFSRKLTDIKDIDKTIDSFILGFKDKFLPDIQFNIASNKRLFIKNSLDFYRSKGTPRAVDLFFKLIYGIEAKIYYPSDDIFKPSDNTWVNVTYLEVEFSNTNVQAVGQLIYGSTSQSRAYVERLVRVKKGSRYINIFYISNLTGDFVTGEQVSTRDLSTNVTTKVVGSLSRLEINSSDRGFEIGESVYVNDGAGKRAKALVSNTTSYTGVVEFDLVDGGFGYSNKTQIIGSDRVFQIQNVVVDNSNYVYFNDPIQRFDSITQDLLNVEYTDITNTAVLTVNTEVTGLLGGGVDSFTGTVVAVTESLTVNNAGEIVIFYDSTTANSELSITDLSFANGAATSNVGNVESVSASANVIATSANATFTYTFTGDTQLQIGDIVYQTFINDGGVIEVFANGVITNSYSNTTTGNFLVDITRDVGAFRTNVDLKRQSDDAVYTITGMSNTTIGVIDITNTFYTGQQVKSTNTGTTFDIFGIYGFETEAAFTIGSFIDQELLSPSNLYTTEPIGSIAGNTIIGANTYDTTLDLNISVLSNTNIGINSVIGEALEFEQLNIGTIETIITTNVGRGYSFDPYFVIYDPATYHLERYDYIITYEGSEQNFVPGEVIVGQTSGATARIEIHDRNAREIRATRLDHDVNMQNNEIIRGNQTGVAATINSISELRKKDRLGLNANVTSTALTGNGFVTELKIVDSGFGYQDGQNLTLISEVNSERSIGVTGFLEKQGVGEGYYTSRKGFLSSDKYLHDNDFYQEFSYQVLTALPFEIYKDTLVKVLHVAGTKPFGGYVGTNEASLNIQATGYTEMFEIKSYEPYVNTNQFFNATIS